MWHGARCYPMFWISMNFLIFDSFVAVNEVERGFNGWFCWLKPLSSSSHWPDILFSSILSCFVRIPLECGRGIISFFVIYCGSIYSLYICSVSVTDRQSISISLYLCADIGWNADCEILNHNVMSRWLLLALESSLVVWEVLNFVLLNAMWYGNYYVVLSFGFLL